MSDFGPLIQSAAQQYNLDPNIIRSLVNVESSGNPNAVNPTTGASGLLQFIPATAKAYGINPLDPAQAINAGAKMFRENLDRFGGDVPSAVAAHFAGPDQAQWGPKTSAYVQKVASVFNGLQNNTGTTVAQPTPAANPSVDAWLGSAPAQATTTTGAPDVAAWLGQTAQPAPTGAPQPAPAQPVAQSSGPSFGSSVVQGMDDGLNAVKQLGVHSVQSLPSGVASFIEKMPLIGPAVKMLGMVPAQQVDNTISQQDQQYAASRAAAGQTGIDWGRGVGNAAVTAPLALAAPETAGMGLLGKAGVGATLGSVYGAASPVTSGSDFWTQKAKQAGIGAAVGGIAAPVTSAIGGALSGVQDTAQSALQRAGVTMTPGQILGGAWKATEDKLTSVPILGDLIKGAQQRSVQSFNNATYNQVLAPLGQMYSGPVGTEGVAAVQKTIGNAYDSALSKMTFNAQDPGFQAELAKVAQMAQSLPDAQKQQFLNLVQTQIVGKLSPQGVMTGDTLKGVQSELGRVARGYSGDASFDTRTLGAAVGAVKTAIDNSLPNYNAPEAVAGLQAANAAYANFVRLRAAAASQAAMNNGGVFTAGQLNNAVRGADKSVGKGATATGNALMQDFSTAGQSILGNKYPDSGTAGRGLLATIGGLGVAGLAGHELVPPGLLLPAAGAIGLGAIPYTGIGQKLTQGLLMNRPQAAQAVGSAITRYGTPLAPVLGAAVFQGANR